MRKESHLGYQKVAAIVSFVKIHPTNYICISMRLDSENIKKILYDTPTVQFVKMVCARKNNNFKVGSKITILFAVVCL